MRDYHAVIFDWDGTLCNSAMQVVTAMQHAAKDLCLPLPTEKEVLRGTGLSFESAVTQLFPDLKLEVINHYYARFSHYFYDSQYSLIMFEGVDNTLRDLQQKKYKLAIATGRRRKTLDLELNESAIGNFFTTSRCADETQSKPHPQMLFEILDELKISPRQALMVGDTEYDILMANAAGVDALAVSYGVHDSQVLQQHKIKGIITDIREIIPWLENYSKT